MGNFFKIYFIMKSILRSFSTKISGVKVSNNYLNLLTSFISINKSK